MDDKQFEEQLKSLKRSYEKIPTMSSTNNILKRVSEQEKPIKKRRNLKLSYVASFVGALLIGSVIGAQIISQSDFGNGAKLDKAEEMPVTEERIESAKNEIRGLFERKIDELSKKLDFENVTLYRFVQETEDTVTRFEERESYANEKELQTYLDKVKEEITRRISTPNEEYDYLKERVNNSKKVTDDELLDYMDKIDVLSENLKSKWRSDYSSLRYSPTVYDDSLYVEMLNDKNVSSGEEDYLAFVELIIDYGYQFYVEGEGVISFDIHTQQILEDFEDVISEDLKKYLELKAYIQTLKDISKMEMVKKELLQKIVELEEMINANPAFRNIVEVKALYKDALVHFLWNNNVETLGLLPKLHPHTQAAKLIDEVIQYIQQNQGQSVPEEMMDKMLNSLPSELKPLGVYEGITLSLFPLTEHMEQIYMLFRNNQEIEMFNSMPFNGKGTHELSIARIYLYALENGDYETAYALSYPDEKLPDFNTFENELKAKEIDFLSLSKEVVHVSQEYEENGEVINHILIKRNGERIILQMHKYNEAAMIAYPPFQ